MIYFISLFIYELNKEKRYNFSDLYYARYRYYFYDFISNIYIDDKLIEPRPDYYEDSIILIKVNDKFFDFNTMDWEFHLNIDSSRELRGSGISQILEIEPLANLLDLDYLNNDKINRPQSYFVLSTIVKSRKLKRNYFNEKKQWLSYNF